MRVQIPVGSIATEELITSSLLGAVADPLRPALAKFFAALHKFYTDLAFTYLEINPIVVTEDGKVTPLDLAAKVSSSTTDCDRKAAPIPPHGAYLCPRSAKSLLVRWV